MGRFRVFLGFLAAGFYVAFAHAVSWRRLAAGLAIAFLGLLLRGWAAGYLEKGKRLAQDGPYAVFRHPLYTGSFFLALGFVLAGTGTEPRWHGIVLWAVFMALFGWVYPRRIREEEATLERHFGEPWRRYCGSNRRFLPVFRFARRENSDVFRWKRYLKNREFNAALGFLAGAALLASKVLAGW